MQIKAGTPTGEGSDAFVLKRQTSFVRAYSYDGSRYLKEIVMLGDAGVGKTMLLSRLRDNDFHEMHKSTIYDRLDLDVNVQGRDHCVRIHDTNSQRELSLSRASIYRDASCLILCYAVDSRRSYDNVIMHWSKEAQFYGIRTPVVLIATKIDLRDSNTNCLTTEEGKRLSQKIGATKFVECSAKANINVQLALDEAIGSAITRPRDSLIPRPVSLEAGMKPKRKMCVLQ